MALLLLLFLTTISYAEDRPLSQKEIELERQRLQLERDRFELEKEKFELEKQKSLYRQSTATQAPYSDTYTPIAPKTRYTKDLYLGGAYLIRSNSRRTTTLNGTEDESEGAAYGYGIKLGFGTFDENRVEIAYSRLTLTLDEEDTEWDVAMLSLDYLFVYHEAFGKHLSPLIKVGLAAAQSNSLNETLRAMGYDVSGDEKIEGMGLKLGVGIVYLLDERMEFSFGIDSAGISWNDTTLSHSGGTDQLELYDSIGLTYLSLNYRF